MPESPSARRMVTLAAIADLAGTSVPTVSKVLNGGTDVSEATRARVLESAHELGYRRKPRGRATAARRSASIIDVVVGNVEGSWIGRVLEGIEQQASAAGVDLVLTVARSERDWVAKLLRRPTLGAIVVLIDVAPAQLAALSGAGVPVVLVDPRSRPAAEVASVGATNWDGGRLAAEHLLALGHRRFAIVGGRRADQFGNARIDGFTTALRSAGITVPADRLVFCDWSRDRARTAFGAIVAATDGPIAVFACSDQMALGVYDAVVDAGLHIPADVSVVGFDDVLESAWATPPMTTIRQPIVDMGSVACRMMLDAHRSVGKPRDGAPTSRIELETHLIERSSTAPPR